MSQTTAMTVELPTDVVRSLQALAEQTGQDVVGLVSEALAQFLARQAREIAGIDEAIAEADAGAPRFSNETVMAWLESWETPNELPLPA